MTPWIPLIDAMELMLALYGVLTLLRQFDEFCDHRRRKRAKRT